MIISRVMLAAAAPIAFLVAAPAMAAERLNDLQLDAMTAGATANAGALGVALGTYGALTGIQTNALAQPFAAGAAAGAGAGAVGSGVAATQVGVGLTNSGATVLSQGVVLGGGQDLFGVATSVDTVVATSVAVPAVPVFVPTY